MADPNRAAISHTNTATMSATCTGANTRRSSWSRTSTYSAAAPCAAAAFISEQRTRRCNQQCRYADYCKKPGYPHHDALLIRGAQPSPATFPLSFKSGAHMVFHANYLGPYPPEWR